MWRLRTDTDQMGTPAARLISMSEMDERMSCNYSARFKQRFPELMVRMMVAAYGVTSGGAQENLAPPSSSPSQ
jgi:hypothetical protein